jgi:hypothetical protein
LYQEKAWKTNLRNRIRDTISSYVFLVLLLLSFHRVPEEVIKSNYIDKIC